MLLEKAFKEGFNKARFEFSQDQGFITKEYFKGYDEAINHVKTFLRNVAPEATSLTIRVLKENDITGGKSNGASLHDGNKIYHDVPLTEAMDAYITDVQKSYRRIVKRLGGE